MKILICGDFCPRGKLFETKMLNSNTDGIFGKLKPHLNDCDISLINAEAAFTDSDTAINKVGPNIKVSPLWTDFLKKQGFSVALCANNHIGDYGDTGVIDTLKHLRNSGLETVGAGENINEARKVLYLKKNGKTISIINFCENEFGIASKDKAGAWGLDSFALIEALKQARKKSDFVIVVSHGGNEINPVPPPSLIKRLRACADNGADAVFNAHQHCPNGYELYNGVPIYYGLGNIVFDHGNYAAWNYGYSVLIEADDKIKTKIIPHFFDAEVLRILENEDYKKFMLYFDCLSKIIADKDESEKYYLAHCAKRGQHWLNRLRSQDDYASLNLLRCEAHAELLKTYLSELISGIEKPWLAQYISNYEKLCAYQSV